MSRYSGSVVIAGLLQLTSPILKQDIFRINRKKGEKMSFNDSAFRVKNFGDSTYYRPTREAADRAACECLKHYGRGCSGLIEALSDQGWKIVARFGYGHGIVDEPASQSASRFEM